MDRDTAWGDLVPRNGVADELLGEGAVLALGHHPSDGIAAKEVEDQVQVQEHPWGVRGELAYVP